MAATSALDARDAMRYSSDVQLLETQLAGGQRLVSLGTREQVRGRLEALLEVALQRDDHERVGVILAAIDQLDSMSSSSSFSALPAPNDDAGFPSALPAPNEDAAGAEQADDWEAYDPAAFQFFSPSPQPSSARRPAAPVESGPLDCPICFDTVEADSVRYIRACGHRYCRDCLQQHLKTLIDEGKVTDKELICPSPGCGESPDPEELHQLVDGDVYNKFLEFLVLNELKTDTNARWCINKQCAQPILWDPSVPKVECPACKTQFCFHCKNAWHEGSCPFVQTKEDEQFIRYLKHQGNASKPCPRCHTAIEKSAGCNHMTCSNCRHQWCWLCLADYDAGHYSSGPCAGMQFTQADSLWGAKAKKVARTAAIGAGCVVAAPLVIAGGAVLLAGGLIALPFYGIHKAINR